MSNFETVNGIYEISEVVVGSIVRIDTPEGASLDRKVLANLGSDLLVEGPFGSQVKYSSVASDNDGEVYVVKQPVTATSASVPSGTSSVHAALTAKFAAPQNTLKAELDARFAKRNPTAPKAFDPKTAFGAQATTVDPTADLRASLNQRGTQASVEAVDRRVTQTNDSLNVVRGQVNDVSRRSIEVANKVDRYAGRTDVAVNAVDSLSRRIDKLELHQKVTTGLNSVETNQNKTAQSAQGGTSMSIKNLLGNFTNNFGKIDNQFALTAFGLAVKDDPRNPFAGYVVYDPAKNTITEANGLVISENVPAFKLPVAPDQVKAGDIVLNDGKYQYVVETNDDYVTTICPSAKARGSVLPLRNGILNQSFYTVVKTLDVAGQSGFNPAMLMLMGDSSKKNDLLPILLATGGFGGATGGAGLGGIDPMMLALLGDNMDDILPFFLFQQGGAAPAGFNPLTLLLLAKDGGSNKDMLLPLILGGGLGGAQGATAGANPLSNPLVLMSLLGDKGGKGGGLDLTALALMGGLGGQGLFGAQAPATTAKVADVAKEKGGK